MLEFVNVAGSPDEVSPKLDQWWALALVVIPLLTAVVQVVQAVIRRSSLNLLQAALERKDKQLDRVTRDLNKHLSQFVQSVTGAK